MPLYSGVKNILHLSKKARAQNVKVVHPPFNPLIKFLCIGKTSQPDKLY